MKERHILFSAPMVRALLAGTKTQTRRVVKPRDLAWMDEHQGLREPCNAERCPYGQPGDRLWVRESFAKIDGQTQPWIETDYRATYKNGDRLGDTLGIKKRWIPSIHMPRAGSRITLEITDVRAERLQDISEADAIAEGVQADPGCRQDDDAAGFHRIGPVRGNSFPIARYAALWDQINGEGTWDANPWVWVVSFNRVAA